MSIPIQSTPTPVGAYQAYFGAPPDGQDKKAECEKWERLCGELLAERERLRAELEKERLDGLCKNFQLEQTMAEVYAQVDRECSLDQIITDLERKPGPTA